MIYISFGFKLILPTIIKLMYSHVSGYRLLHLNQLEVPHAGTRILSNCCFNSSSPLLPRNKICTYYWTRKCKTLFPHKTVKSLLQQQYNACETGSIYKMQSSQLAKCLHKDAHFLPPVILKNLKWPLISGRGCTASEAVLLSWGNWQ